MTPSERTNKNTSLVVRRGQQEILLGAGECLIGRDPDCGMRLTDPLVSRKHAKITVERDTATITDLSSANGVYVNGRRVLAATPLKPGDLIVIGNEEMEITRLGEPPASSKSGRPQRLSRDTVRMQQDVAPVRIEQGSDGTGRVDALDLISKVVDRVLAEGRGSDAERMLSPQLDMLLLEVTRRGTLPVETVNRASEYAVRLAAATRNGRWINYVVHLHMALMRPMPSGTAGALVSAAQSCTDFDRVAVRSYVSRLLSTAERLTPLERSDLEMLGGLAGPVSSR